MLTLDRPRIKTKPLSCEHEPSAEIYTALYNCQIMDMYRVKKFTNIYKREYSEQLPNGTQLIAEAVCLVLCCGAVQRLGKADYEYCYDDDPELEEEQRSIPPNRIIQLVVPGYNLQLVSLGGEENQGKEQLIEAQVKLTGQVEGDPAHINAYSAGRHRAVAGRYIDVLSTGLKLRYSAHLGMPYRTRLSQALNPAQLDSPRVPRLAWSFLSWHYVPPAERTEAELALRTAR